MATINAKHGGFAALIAIGDFLGTDPASALAPYKSGHATPPLPTYFYAPQAIARAAAASDDSASTEVSPGAEIAPSIIYLGAGGVSEVAGLQIAFISDETADAAAAATADAAAAAAAGTASTKSDASLEFQRSVQTLRSMSDAPGFTGVDLFLSSAWPRGFFRSLPEFGNGSLPAELLEEKDLHQVKPYPPPVPPLPPHPYYTRWEVKRWRSSRVRCSRGTTSVAARPRRGRAPLTSSRSAAAHGSSHSHP